MNERQVKITASTGFFIGGILGMADSFVPYSALEEFQSRALGFGS